MTIKLKSLGVNLDKERNGEWIESLEFKGVSYMVRSIHSPAFGDARAELLERMAKQYKNKSAPQEEVSKQLGILYQKHILVDWKGLDEACTPEMAAVVLTDPEYRRVASDIATCAGRVGERDIEYIEDAAKN